MTQVGTKTSTRTRLRRDTPSAELLEGLGVGDLPTRVGPLSPLQTEPHAPGSSSAGFSNVAS